MPRFESSRLMKNHHAIKTPLFLSSMDIELREVRARRRNDIEFRSPDRVHSTLSLTLFHRQFT